MSNEKNQTSVEASGISSVFERLTGSLKDAIFEKTPQDATEETERATKLAAQAQAVKASTASVDNPMMERLHQAIMGRTTGFRQLVTNMQALEKIILDENSRLRAAFAVLQQNGASVPNLLQDIELHVRDLETQGLRFREEADKERRQRVGEREKALADAKSAIDKAQDEMARQQKIIVAEQAKIANLTTEIQNQTIELDRASQQFLAAMEYEKNWLTRQSQSIKAISLT